MIKSEITQDDMSNAMESLLSISNNQIYYSAGETGDNTNNYGLTEGDARDILSPFINDGLQIRDQLLEYCETAGYAEFDITELRAITEEQWTELSFLLNTALLQVSSDQIKACLYAAVGVTYVKKLLVGTTGLFTAETVIGILKNVGKRYLGYIGVAIVIIEFLDCIGS